MGLLAPTYLRTFAVSVDLEVAVDRLGHRQEAGLERVTDDLLKLFARHSMAATWAVADPLHSAATERIRSANKSHEMAILGDSTWVGRTAGRSRFSRELGRRVLSARAAGLEVTTFVPGGTGYAEHLDLVHKHGITGVRTQTSQLTGKRKSHGMATLRYGLVEFPVGVALPAEGNWLNKLGRLSLAFRAVDRQDFCQLVLDAPALIAAGPAAMRTVQRVVERAARLRDRHLLAIETLGKTAANLRHAPQREPSQSILRRAA